ncbi:cell division protein FtsQ [Corynebacterium sp. HMSC05D08]|uniref:FtsQ-type POTRA domain-containing protein n=1 Tax=Corynebacterium striatum TaxID=43770 RepID=A0ABX7DDE3_CORST|nr:MULTISPECIES: FtsQ-type POTRA domain-containing protein [Corynebacterium]OFT61959.1 cell division protein FtsQ [Corynebacterium sp. HMSC05D08]QQU76711.1 FtsQ-type POTRA domain-containing protein [Corynebacterium striatum]
MSKKSITAIVAGILAVLVLAAAAVWLFPVFKVSSFEIQGNSHVDAAQVEESSGVAVGENLVRVDARAAASGVAHLPWVKSATVSRAFPSTLDIEVIEHEAVAFREGNLLIDAEGKEFTTDTPPEGAVEITGSAEPGSQDLRDAVDVLAALPQNLRAQVKSLEVKNAYSMTFHLQDERTVFWGASEDNANKALAFETVLKMEGQNWNISNPELVTSK